MDRKKTPHLDTFHAVSFLESFEYLIHRKHELSKFFVIFYGILLSMLLLQTFEMENIYNSLLINLSQKMIKNGIF